MYTLRPLVISLAVILAGALSGTSAAAQETATPAKGAAGAPRPTLADSTVAVVDLTPKQGSQLQPLLKAEFAKAIAGHQTPFVELGATWCGPCQHLKASLGDARMIDAFAGTYIIRLDVDEWKDQLKPLGLASSDGIPAFLPIDQAGKAIGPIITGSAWGEDIPENMAPPLKTFFRANLRKG